MIGISIGSDTKLSPIWHQAIIKTNAGLLSIAPLGTNLSEILINIQNYSVTKMHVKISSAKWWPCDPGGDELMCFIVHHMHDIDGLVRHWRVQYWSNSSAFEIKWS